MANKATYNQESIEVLKGADRVRKRPAVIFGSDGIEGCEHSVFEIISNSVDEAREGFGNTITVTRFEDKSVEVQDQGRGIPVEYNQKEKEYNWKLTFCELYAGGKYKTNDGGSYQFSRHKRTRSLRHSVCLGIYGGGNTFKWLLLSSEFQGRQARR